MIGPVLLAAAAAPAPPMAPPRLACSIKKSLSNYSSGSGDTTYDIEMHSTYPTPQYKSSFCGFSDDTGYLQTYSGSSASAGCDACVRDSDFSVKCHCTCPASATKPCTWKWSGKVSFDPDASNPQCYCNGVPVPTPPAPPKPPPPPPPPPPGPPPPCKAKLDVVVVLDGSASIQAPNWQRALTFTEHLVQGFNISAQQVEMAVVQFSEDAQTVIGLSDDSAAILNAVQNLIQMQLNTNTYKGFKQAKSILDSQGRAGTAGKAVILLTDGDQDEGLPASIEANALKASNVTIFGVGVGIDPMGQRSIEQWVSAPAVSHYFAVTAWTALEKVLQKIIQSACPPP